MENIPDIVFLSLGIICLIVLLSIRSELQKINRKISHKQIRSGTLSFEDIEKYRIRYLRECRHFRIDVHNQEKAQSLRASGKLAG